MFVNVGITYMNLVVFFVSVGTMIILVVENTQICDRNQFMSDTLVHLQMASCE